MNEIDKLRLKLGNVRPFTKDFYMTVQDARDLLADIDAELTAASKKIVHVKPPEKDLVAVQHVIMDGGSFYYPPGYSPPEFKLPEGTLIKP